MLLRPNFGAVIYIRRPELTVNRSRAAVFPTGFLWLLMAINTSVDTSETVLLFTLFRTLRDIRSPCQQKLPWVRWKLESYYRPSYLVLHVCNVTFISSNALQMIRLLLSVSVNHLQVAVLMALETIYTVSLYHILYFYSVQSFGDVEKFGVVLWSFVLQRFVSCFLCTITQCFFAIRVYYLNGHRLYTPILISITSMLNITSAISVTVIGAFLPKPFTQSRIVAFGRVGTFTTLIPLSGDVIITTSTVYHLQKTRIQTIGTDRAIYKLIMYTLNTGLLITLFALMSGISTFVQREMFTYAPFDFVLSRLYACSLISVLNSRAAVQRELAQVDHSIGSGNNIFTSVAPDVPILATTSSHA